MIKFLIKKIFLLSVFLIPFNANSDEYFCLDKDGFVYPLFEEKHCENQLDDKINKDEFSFIIEFNQKSRLTQLEEYRKNPVKVEEETDKKIVKNLKDNSDKAIKEKKEELEQKKIKKLAKENDKQNRIALIKERQEKQKQKRLALIKKRQEKQKQKRLALIKERQEKQKQKQLAKQNELKLKKQKQLAKQKELKLKKQKQLAKQKELKLKKQKQLAKKDKVEPSTTLNTNLKIVYLNKDIVKKESLPDINPNSIIDFSKIDLLQKEGIKNLFANNSNLILIIPSDLDSFSTVVSENQIPSKLVAGTRQVPNPEFNRLQMEIRRAERELQTAQRNEQDGFARSQCMSCGLLVQWGGLAIQSKWQKTGRALQNRIVNLTNSYSSTPDYLEKEILQSYSYVVQNVKAEKSALFKVILSKDNKYIEKNISINKNKTFKVAYNIDPQDKKYETLLNKYSNTDQVTRWQNQKFDNISLDKLTSLIDQETSFKEILGKKELYASLNFEYEEESTSWFSGLFDFFKSDDKKTASLSNKSSSKYEVKDVRFDSVVIVKTENGLGSGFFISKDEIITNYHVIENATSISVTDVNGKRSSAVVIKKDLRRDLALIKTNIIGKPVEFYVGQLKQGEMVEALGHPKGRKFSLTKGWISAIRKESGGYSATNEKNVLFIQTDAAINHGNSGGPLFYKDKVVGVNTQGLSKKKTEGMNFAVHFSEVNKFISK